MNAKFLICILAVVSLTVPKAAALDLVMTFDDSVAYIDAQGHDRTYELVGIVEAAKLIWEDIIEDEITLEITYGWSDLDGGALANYGSRIQFDTRDFDGGPARSWFIDPTPLDHSEFDFSSGQRLVRDADPDLGWFTGDTPALLEIGYVGQPRQNQGYDLLTVALHEIGHWLGVTRFDAYSINPDFVGGAVMGIEAKTGHLLPTTALMYAYVGTTRKLPSAADVLAAASNGGWMHIDLPRQDFLGRDGDQRWTNSLNWVGNQVPGARDNVYLRHGGIVRLAAAGTETQRVADLFVEDGTGLVIEKRAKLKVEADPSAWDSHGKLTLKDGGSIVVAGSSDRFPTLEAQSMDLVRGSTLSLAEGTVWIHGELSVDACDVGASCQLDTGAASVITGFGLIKIDDRLTNGGQIAGRVNASNASPRGLTFVAPNEDTLWDLSASPLAGKPGFGQVVASQGDVQFSGGRAAPFDGRMLAENGYSILFDTATLSTAGELIVRDDSSYIFAPEIENSGSVELRSGGSLRTLRFQNAGGTIRGDGRIVFSDSFTNEGATILADRGQTLALAATARSVYWDLGGSSPDCRWIARDGGTIRFGAAAAESVQLETFDGWLSVESGGSIEFDFPIEFEIPVGPAARIDIVGPDSTMIASHAALTIGVANDAFNRETARVRVDHGRLEANAIDVGGDTESGLGHANLQLDHGEVFANRELVIWPNGRVDGVGTIQADVVNLGTLAGSIDIDGDFSQAPGGIIAMELANATSHDHMVINGHATLDGILQLEFGEPPKIGDTFEIMDYSSVTGRFRQIILPLHMQADFAVATGQLLVTAVAPEPSALRLLAACLGGLLWRIRNECVLRP